MIFGYACHVFSYLSFKTFNGPNFKKSSDTSMYLAEKLYLHPFGSRLSHIISLYPVGVKFACLLCHFSCPVKVTSQDSIDVKPES